MNVTIITVDKLREAYLRDGCELYVRRLAPYCAVTVEETAPALGPDARAGEGRALLKRLPPGAVVWALHREGEHLTSEDLAARLAAVEASGKRHLALVIGGPLGLDPAVLRRADFRWSLSAHTLLHEMARLLALEQLYRAIKINRREPYHR